MIWLIWWPRDYNHPSVIMYSIGNEVSETAQPRGIALTDAMTHNLHGLDATRPVTCGVNIFFNFLSSMGLGVYTDEKAMKEIEHSGKEEGGRQRILQSARRHHGSRLHEFGATLPPCDWKTRGAFAVMDVAGYNYGIRRYRHDLNRYPNRVIVGSETFCSDAARFWDLAQSNPRLIGDFVWSGMDYLGKSVSARRSMRNMPRTSTDHLAG
ncbi:MAG: glycoside hydrolase family 2 TIM barrel-domain containing protein [Bifidobacterium adolescentis]